MNTSFNFSRFLKVLSNEWRMNMIKMLLFWGVMIIISIIYFAFLRYTYSHIIPKFVTFALTFFVMCIAQGFYLQIYYNEFSSKTKTQAMLLLPASKNEKFWAKFLLGFILYPVFFLAYIFIVLKMNEIYNDWAVVLKNISIADEIYKNEYQTLIFDLTTKRTFFYVWLLSASAYLFGNLLFKKRPAFKSLLFWFIVVLGLSWITSGIYTLFTGVWPTHSIPGVLIGIDKYNTVSCAMTQMYPELLHSLAFICLALILISRIKYNEKTI